MSVHCGKENSLLPFGLNGRVYVCAMFVCLNSRETLCGGPRELNTVAVPYAHVGVHFPLEEGSANQRSELLSSPNTNSKGLAMFAAFKDHVFQEYLITEKCELMQGGLSLNCAPGQSW